jgi:hypothetical protein
MIQWVIAHTAHAEAVAEAGGVFGASVRAKPFIASDLERLRQPVVIAFDAARALDITPDVLLSQRRTLGGAIRYSPVIVFSDAERRAWLDAGAFVLAPASSARRVKDAIKTALSADEDWVTSATYIGPSRRSQNALLPLSRRRAEDQEPRAGGARARGGAPTASLGVISRRLSLSVALLTGSTIEARRAFRKTVEEMRAGAIAHGRPDLSAAVEALLGEAIAFEADARRDNSAAERAVAALNRLLEA